MRDNINEFSGMQKHVIGTGEPWGLPQKYELLPQFLKKGNYASHLRGKWHLGFHTPAFLPVSRGFDSSAGPMHGFIDYYTHEHISVSWGSTERLQDQK